MASGGPDEDATWWFGSRDVVLSWQPGAGACVRCVNLTVVIWGCHFLGLTRVMTGRAWHTERTLMRKSTHLGALASQGGHSNIETPRCVRQ